MNSARKKILPLFLLLLALPVAGLLAGPNEAKIKECIENFKKEDHNFCVGVLRELRGYGNESVPYLLKAYKESGSAFQKLWITHAMGGLTDDRAVAFLLERLEQDDRAAETSLHDTGRAAEPGLLKVLRGGSPAASLKAAILLSRWQAPEALPRLLEALKSDPGHFRYSGVPYALGAYGEAVIPKLLKAMEDPDAQVSANAKDVLKTMGRGELLQPKKEKPAKGEILSKKLGITRRNVTGLSADRKAYNPIVMTFLLSPDGDKLAYTVGYGGSGLWAIRGDGTGNALVTRDINPVGDFAWSRDGRLVFDEYKERGGYTDQLCLAEPGNAAPPIKIKGNVFEWAKEERKRGPVEVAEDLDDWPREAGKRIHSPDGARYVFTEGGVLLLGHRGKTGSEALYRVPGRDANFWKIVWSPDSRTVAFAYSAIAGHPLMAMWGGRDQYLCVVDAVSKADEKIQAPAGMHFRNYQWAPKGKKLYYSTDDIFVLEFSK